MKRFLLAASLLCLSVTAHAVPTTGDWEIVFSNAQGSIMRSDEATQVSFAIQSGYFFTEQHEAGFGISHFRYEDDAFSTSNTDLLLFYQYNFRTLDDENWFYAGVDADENDYSAYVGRKWMLEENVAFDINAGWNTSHRYDHADDYLSIRFGLGIFF